VKRLGRLLFSHDGTMLIASDFEHGLRLWDARTDRQLTQFDEVRGAALDLALSPDGRHVALAVGRYLQPKEIQIRELLTGKLVRCLCASAAQRSSLAFAPDGKALAWIESGTGQRELQIWSTATGERLGTFAPVDFRADRVEGVDVCGVRAISFSRDGKWIAI